MKITITEPDAALLETLLGRLTWEDVRLRAVDKAECERMLWAAEKLRQQLRG
jgi:hypothetical protein